MIHGRSLDEETKEVDKYCLQTRSYRSGDIFLSTVTRREKCRLAKIQDDIRTLTWDARFGLDRGNRDPNLSDHYQSRFRPLILRHLLLLNQESHSHHQDSADQIALFTWMHWIIRHVSLTVHLHLDRSTIWKTRQWKTDQLVERIDVTFDWKRVLTCFLRVNSDVCYRLVFHFSSTRSPEWQSPLPSLEWSQCPRRHRFLHNR